MRALRCTVEGVVLATRSLARLLLICSVALNFANIIGRYFFHSSLSWGINFLALLLITYVPAISMALVG
jgi:TRAP-type C4-dicarboxylate transport system permease small subunit